MTPQSSFMISAPVDLARLPELKVLLASLNMKHRAGMADPKNSVIPFGQFSTLHYARFVILDDQTLDDFERIGEPAPVYPLRLAFLGDCDGEADDFLNELAERAGAGLQQIFSHCEGFNSHTHLLSWMKQHCVRAAAAYVNHIGRTVTQIHGEDALRRALVKFLKEPPPADDGLEDTRNKLISYAHENGLIPRPTEPTPIGWRIRNILHAATLPAVVLVVLIALLAALSDVFRAVFGSVFPFQMALIAATLPIGWQIRNALGTLILPIMICVFVLIFIIAVWIVFRIVVGSEPPFAVSLFTLALTLAVQIFLTALRSHEKAEPEIAIKPTDEHAEELGALEDHDAVNQFSVIGSVKPSAFRRWMLPVNFWVINWFARHIYNSRYLARIRTIHFARWTFLDDNRRVMFASTYDGSLESYNDDFVNKGGFGLNFAFGAGLGYPRTTWIIFDGAKDEQKFKYALRRHQLPTQVWYNAYPGLTVYDLARNARVRDGLERATMSEAEIRTWLADL
jgi:hypothetical protein